MIWLLVSLVALGVAVLLAVPLLSPSREPENRREADLAVLRAQLAQLDDDQAQGLLSETEADSARLEAQRRILRTIAQAEKMDTARSSGKPARGLAIVLMALVIAGSLGLYWKLGNPRPPLSADIIRAKAKQTGATAQQDQSKQRALSLAEQLRKRLADNPKDRDAWLLLGRTYASIARHAAAAEAFGRALEIKSDDAAVLAELGEALVLAVSGRVTGPARAAFLRALELDKSQAAARFFLALHDYQNTRPQAAYDKWLALIKDLPGDNAGYRATLSQLRRVAKELGIDLAKELPAAKSVTPDQPGAGKSGPERSKFILSMVERLATRLKEEPDDVPGWMRLGRSYMVLKLYKKAAAAYGEAVKRRPRNADIQAKLGRALVQGTAPGQPLSKQTIDVFKKVLRLDAKHPDALWFLGWGDVLTGNRAGATAYWQRLLHLMKPGSEQYKNLSAALVELKKPK